MSFHVQVIDLLLLHMAAADECNQEKYNTI